MENSTHEFNTLAQLTQPFSESSNYENMPPLWKRAKAKFLTNCFVYKLVEVKNSTLIKKYWNSYHCTSEMKQQNGKIISKYCNCRWCLVCNRIRTAKLINGYSEVLDKLEDKYFVTLTLRNCEGNKLKETIELMYKNFRHIQKKHQKKSSSFVGVRKFECTYNAFRDNYHPHYHFLISGGETAANLLVNEWLAINPNLTDRKGQDIRKADDRSSKELFKYFTKFFSSEEYQDEEGKIRHRKKIIPCENLDIIFSAMQGKRVFQSLGIKKVTEEVDEENLEDLESQEYEVSNENCFWTFEQDLADWVNEKNIQLTGYTPTNYELNLISQIK